jgi:succinate dehydrogenase / fumarate reductase flavoprotein subunit
MYHQFMELAGVDITREPMEIGPTCHYIMGGVKVDAETAATKTPGLFAAGEVAAGLHGANRLGGNSLSDLIVFGKRAGEGAVSYIAAGGGSGKFKQSDVDAAIAEALAPFDREEGENPYDIQRDLQDMMQANVGIIRTGDELEFALGELEKLTDRVRKIRVKGGRAYNPGWNLATDLPAMITVSKCVAMGALNRKESRGGHTRNDFPETVAEMGTVNFTETSTDGKWDGKFKIEAQPIPTITPELKALLEEAK